MFFSIKKLVRKLTYAITLASLTWLQPSMAATKIQINSTQLGQQVHGSRIFKARFDQLCLLMSSPEISHELHPWLGKSQLLSQPDKHTRLYRVEYRLPWPLNKQWSLLRVEYIPRQGLSWTQLAGSFHTNQGRINLRQKQNELQLEYIATTDIGLPGLLVRPFQRQFIKEMFSNTQAMLKKTSFSSAGQKSDWCAL